MNTCMKRETTHAPFLSEPALVPLWPALSIDPQHPTALHAALAAYGSPTRSELYARAASQLVGLCAAFFAAFARRSDSPHRVHHVRGARAASPSGRATANAQATPSESDERAPNGQANQTSTSQAFKPSERHVSSRASRDSVRGSTARRASTASRRRAQSEPVEKPRTRCRKRARCLCAWVTAVRMQNSL